MLCRSHVASSRICFLAISTEMSGCDQITLDRDESMSHQWFLENVEEELECGLQLELGLGKVSALLSCLQLSSGVTHCSPPQPFGSGAVEQ